MRRTVKQKREEMRQERNAGIRDLQRKWIIMFFGKWRGKNIKFLIFIGVKENILELKAKINMNKEMIVKEGHYDERDRRRWCLEIEQYERELVAKEKEKEDLEVYLAWL